MKILSHLRELSESLEDWRRYQDISIEELRMDQDEQGCRGIKRDFGET
jgi:hypothetical protein